MDLLGSQVCCWMKHCGGTACGDRVTNGNPNLVAYCRGDVQGSKVHALLWWPTTAGAICGHRAHSETSGPLQE